MSTPTEKVYAFDQGDVMPMAEKIHAAS